jgi:hypothetical protein
LEGVLAEIWNLLLSVDLICLSSLPSLGVASLIILIMTMDLKLKYKLYEQPLIPILILRRNAQEIMIDTEIHLNNA